MATVKKEKTKRIKVESDNDNDDDNVTASERPTDSELKTVIRRLIPKVNLQKTGVKAFIKLLSKECGGLDLKHRSDYIKKELSSAINEMESEEESEEDEDEESDNDEDDGKAKRKGKRKAASTKASSTSKEGKVKRAAGKGLSVKKEISEDLANFLGQGKEMARTEIVKALWDYIKEHDLQNPDNKREILLDSKMQQVFGCETFTMFTMNKYVAAHIHPFKAVDLTPKDPKPRKKRKTTKKTGNEPPLKKKRKPKKPGLQPPYRLSKEMAAVAGKDVLPRPQVVTKLWEYIKKHDLQNPNDKREIICDEKLKSIMGGNDTVTMFNMNRYITDHLLEKLDRSAYTHEGDEGEEDEGGEKIKEEEEDDDDEEEEEEAEDAGDDDEEEEEEEEEEGDDEEDDE